MSDAKKYILFVAQEASFCSRSLLLPYDAIMQCKERVADLNVLRQHAKKNVKFGHMGEKYIVDQLLIQNITWSDRCGTPDIEPFTTIVQQLVTYADWGAEHVSRDYDEEWTKEMICNVASGGFNHIVNYCNFRQRTQYKKKQIDIVEGFLVLQTDNKRPITMPEVDNEEEMYETYY